MLLKHFYDTKLAQASYMVGCQATGEALIIDPSRDIEPYVRAAKVEGMRIAYVTETHIHADFVSGSRELAAATGAAPLLSDEGGPGWTYGWGKDEGARLVRDGDVVMVGNVRVEVLHTPGHTPEHICFRLTDTRATERPMGVFTGDFVFVGDVGRPDLLERAAGFEGTMETGARTLFRSLQAFKANPDYLQIWPGHGAGSACGKALGAVPSSTMGYERFANWGLTAGREADFVAQVLAGQPDPPAYFKHMKRVNRDGPPVLGARALPPALEAATLRATARSALVVDTRGTADFARGHVPGTLNVPLGNSFATYAGSIVEFGTPVRLIVARERLEEAVRALASIGFDDVPGWYPPDALAAAGPLELTPQLGAADAAARLAAGAVTLVDVRGLSEWEDGHAVGARHIPLGRLAAHADALAKAGPLVLMCETGSRSAVAASILLARGVTDLSNQVGGFTAWKKAGLPLEAGAALAAGARHGES